MQLPHEITNIPLKVSNSLRLCSHDCLEEKLISRSRTFSLLWILNIKLKCIFDAYLTNRFSPRKKHTSHPSILLHCDWLLFVLLSPSLHCFESVFHDFWLHTDKTIQCCADTKKKRRTAGGGGGGVDSTSTPTAMSTYQNWAAEWHQHTDWHGWINLLFQTRKMANFRSWCSGWSQYGQKKSPTSFHWIWRFHPLSLSPTGLLFKTTNQYSDAGLQRTRLLILKPLCLNTVTVQGRAESLVLKPLDVVLQHKHSNVGTN